MKTLFILSLLMSTFSFAEGNGGERGGENDLVLSGNAIHCIDYREEKKASFLCADTYCSKTEVCNSNLMNVDYSAETLGE